MIQIVITENSKHYFQIEVFFRKAPFKFQLNRPRSLSVIDLLLPKIKKLAFDRKPSLLENLAVYNLFFVILY